jgi:hypothetical protein
VLLFSGEFAELRKGTISFVMSVCPSAWNSALAGRIFMKFDMSIFRKCAEEFRVSIKSDKNNAQHST